MVRATAAFFVFVLLAGASCGDDANGDDAGPPDATPSDGGGGADVLSGGGGLGFEFIAVPALPGITSDVSVDELRVELRDVRAIGDSAPGDSRTSIAQLSLDWRAGDDPAPLQFPQAPPGIYSNLEARVGSSSGGRRFEIRGHVRVGGVNHAFRIENDDSAVRVTVNLAGLAVAAQPRTAVIAVALGFLGNVRWSDLGDDEELKIESGNPQMAAVEAGLAAAFSLASVR